MKKIAVDTIVFDFDSTILRGELLEILAQRALENNPRKDEILKQIKQITNLGMEGEIAFHESLERRLKLLALNEKSFYGALGEVEKLLNEEYLALFPKIKHKHIYIVSGGYKNIIDRLNQHLFIPKQNIYAINLFFKRGKFSHFDANSPLILSDGKARVVSGIKNCGKTLMVGDGMTDFQVKNLGVAEYFAAYTGVVCRNNVAKQADFVIDDLRQLVKFVS